MKTVGNDLVRNQLHADRKWYLILGFVLIIEYAFFVCINDVWTDAQVRFDLKYDGSYS